VNDAVAVAADDVAHAGGEERLRHRDAGCPHAGHDDAHVLETLVDYAQSVQQAGEDDDRRPVLIVVEDRDLERLPQAPLDLEAARRGDVLEIDPAEDRREQRDDANDLVGVCGIEADRERVHTAELLEEHGFALHHGHCRGRADIAEPEDGSTVTDYCDGVLFDRQRPRFRGVVGDRARDTGDAGRVGHREIVARLQRRLRDDFQLPAEMEQERPVGDVLDPDAVDASHRCGDALELIGIDGQNGDVTNFLIAVDAYEVDGVEEAAFVGDRLRNRSERSGSVLEVHPQRRAELRRRVSDRRPVGEVGRHAAGTYGLHRPAPSALPRPAGAAFPQVVQIGVSPLRERRSLRMARARRGEIVHA
jgi:hypothetical protein